MRENLIDRLILNIYEIYLEEFGKEIADKIDFKSIECALKKVIV